VQNLLVDLNRLYRQEPALHLLDCDPAGFEWIDGGDAENSVLTFLRKAPNDSSMILVACNFTPVLRHGYRIGVPAAGYWRPLLNSDEARYRGSGVDSGGPIAGEAVSAHGRPLSVEVTLPPLAAVFFKRSGLAV
jgi:1,4-alpha-glucan branching enzyme